MEREYDVQCSSESEHMPLNNRWCLRQIQEDGSQVGHDLVPCSKSLYFEALNVVHTITYTDDHATTPARLETRELLYAELRPETLSSRTWLNAPSYYMLGYADAIRHISLEISRNDKDDHCIVSGFEKFEGDWQLDDHPHSLHFSVNLSPGHFDSISRLVRLNKLDRLSLIVQFAEGFYSEYDVSGYSHIDKVYVLSNRALTQLNLEEYSEHLPVTGKVGNFVLHAGSKVSVGSSKEKAEEDVSISSEELSTSPGRLSIEAQMERTNALLSDATDAIEKLNSFLNPMHLILCILLLVAIVLLLGIFFQNM